MIARELDSPARGGLNRKLVGEIDPFKQRHQLVITVGKLAQHIEEQIHFRVSWKNFYIEKRIKLPGKPRALFIILYLVSQKKKSIGCPMELI